MLTRGPRTFPIACALAAASAIAGRAPAQTVSHQLVASGLVKPMQVASVPGDESRLYVVEQRGRVRLVKDGVLQAAAFLDIDALVPDQTYGGMFGMEFHPDHASNGLFYVHHTTGATGAITVWVAEYRRGAGSDVADPATRRVVLKVSSPSTQGFHLGGTLCFGTDGLLYVPLGDGGFTGDAGGPQRSQSITGANALWGKVLRIDVDGDDFPADAERNYRIPAGNPFVGIAGEDEILVRGLRNPFRASFDPETGLMWIGDVGGTQREEVDTLDPAADAGANYGWNCAEGTLCTTNANCACGTALKGPVHEYAHTVGLSVTGGAVYRGCRMPGFRGHYFFADYQNNKLFSGTVTAAGALASVVDRTSQFAGGTSTITSICRAADGELYVTNHTPGTVRRIVQVGLPAGSDVDGNGVPDACECAADLVRDNFVDGADLGVMLSQWGALTPVTTADLNRDGAVDGIDLGLLLSAWGSCAG
jgi:glucose/arabinose dehydrogenase